MATRYDQGRKRWVVEFEQAGVRVFRRLPQGATESQGKALETKLRREIFDRETLQKIPALTLERAIEQWLAEDHRRKDRKKMASEARQWVAFAKGKLLRDVPEVAQEAIQQWSAATASKRSRATGATCATTASRDTMSAETASHHTKRAAKTTTVFAAPARSQTVRATGAAISTSPATINRRLAMLKAVCRHAYKQGRIAENLSGRVTMLREMNQREIYLTRQQVMTLASKAPSPQSQSAILLAAYTGLRASEVLSLDAVGPRSDTLSVIGKGDKRRTVPVPPVPVLHGPLRALPLGISYWTLHDEFLVARRKARLGIKGLRFHDLRHTCASWLINAGVDIYTLSKILGHASIQTTQRYAHLYHSTLKDAMSRLK